MAKKDFEDVPPQSVEDGWRITGKFVQSRITRDENDIHELILRNQPHPDMKSVRNN